MSDTRKTAQPQPAAGGGAIHPGLLDDILSTAKRDMSVAQDKDADHHAKQLVQALVTRAIGESDAFDTNVSRSIDKLIERLDQEIGAQLKLVMHDRKFQKLEGSWRGLQHLVANANTGPMLKVKLISINKDELAEDFQNETEDTALYHLLHQDAYNTAGGEPFGALVGDYEWEPGNQDIRTLTAIGKVARQSFAPFLSAASPKLLDLKSWKDLRGTHGLNVESAYFDKWRSFRETEEAGFVALCMPRVLARLPYGKATTPASSARFAFEEAPLNERREPAAIAHDDLCWMNAAYAMAARLAHAFDNHGCCTRIRGKTSGGQITGLPLYCYKTSDGDEATQCPTERTIPDDVEKELETLGFLPLVHYKGTDTAAFLGGQTTRKPTTYHNDTDADDNAAISARLPYVMVASRVAHNLKVMGRDMIGRSLDRDSLELRLNDWIKSFTGAMETSSEELKARRPLREARVEVLEVPGKPGTYDAVAYLRPWLQFEALNASLRMVARLPAATQR